MRCRYFSALLAGILCLLAHAPQAQIPIGDQGATLAARSHPDDVLVLGRVSNNPRKDYQAAKALADYLAAGLGGLGITGAAVQFADDSDKMTALLRGGAVDLVSDTIFAALQYEHETGATLLLREWRDGLPSYRSILFKRQDSPIESLSELPGRKVAFERRGSTTAYMVPRAELETAGFRLHELAAANDQPAPEEIGYIFAGSENNIVVWVHRRLVDIGAFSDIDWDQLEDMPPVLKKDLAILHYSAPLPRALLIGRHGLRPEVELAVRRVLLAAAGDPQGALLLRNYKNVTRYDELTGDAAASVAAARRLIGGP